MKLYPSLLLLLLGLIAGILVYDRWQDSAAGKPLASDTSLVRTASAQDIPDQVNRQDQIYFSRQNAITQAVSKVTPAVVSVNVTKINEYVQRNPYASDPFFRDFFPEFYSDRVFRQQVQSIGSGFIISEDGYIITNEHVVGKNAEEVIIAMNDGAEYTAKIVGQDHVADVALLKIDKNGLPFLRLGDSGKIIIGEWAIALGNPFGLFQKSNPTVTVGVISAVDRDFSPTEGRIYEDMIQTDAAINQGNSGGPLCNADGDVIGINTFIYTGDNQSSGSVGVGFAIPSNHIARLLDDLKKRKDRSADTNIWIGMYVSNLNRYLARQLGFSSTNGVYVKRLDRNSPADKAGIELGDIITAINNYPVSGFNDAEQVVMSSDLRVGDKMNVKIWRQGRELQVTLILARNPN
jgi:serine protease Do